MFGREDKQTAERPASKQERIEQWRQTMVAEYQRLSSLPLAQLAAEVMARGFGPGGPGATQDAEWLTGSATPAAIAELFAPVGGRGRPGLESKEDLQLDHLIEALISEALQQLEHASLVRLAVHGGQGGIASFAATRYGRAALERDQVQRILQ
jgi:hypothetical protein